MTLIGIVAIELERKGGRRSEQIKARFSGEVDGSLLRSANAHVRLSAMSCMPAEGESHPVHFRVEFSHIPAVTGIYELTAKDATQEAVFSRWLAGYTLQCTRPFFAGFLTGTTTPFVAHQL